MMQLDDSVVPRLPDLFSRIWVRLRIKCVKTFIIIIKLYLGSRKTCLHNNIIIIATCIHVAFYYTTDCAFDFTMHLAHMHPGI